jgi:hypothetical protein
MFDLHGDGTLRVRERARRHLRLLIAHAADVSWTVDGKVGPFEADGKAWLRRILKARPAVPVPPKPPEL